MKKQGNPYSVNCCIKCRKNLTITADLLGYIKCAECTYNEYMQMYDNKRAN